MTTCSGLAYLKGVIKSLSTTRCREWVKCMHSRENYGEGGHSITITIGAPATSAELILMKSQRRTKDRKSATTSIILKRTSTAITKGFRLRTYPSTNRLKVILFRRAFIQQADWKYGGGQGDWVSVYFQEWSMGAKFGRLDKRGTS